MDENIASAKSMIHFDRWEPMQELTEPKKRKAGKHMTKDGSRSIFWRDHKLLIIGAALFTLYTIGLSSWVNWKADKRADEQTKAALTNYYETKVVAYWDGEGEAPKEKIPVHANEQVRVVQAKVLTDEESKQAAMERDAVALAKDSDVWKTEEAFKAHCWCAVLRKQSAQYPSEILTVLKQPKQFDYYNEDQLTYSTEKYGWAMEVLQQAETGALPKGLTANHLYLEMKDAGRVCILHTDPEHGYSDDQWRYKE